MNLDFRASRQLADHPDGCEYRLGADAQLMVAPFAQEQLARVELASCGEPGERGQHVASRFYAFGYRRPIVGRDSQARQCEKGRRAWPKAVVAAFIEVEKFHLVLIGERTVCRNFSNLRSFSR
jgi:hypothetical protein